MNQVVPGASICCQVDPGGAMQSNVVSVQLSSSMYLNYVQLTPQFPHTQTLSVNKLILF